MTLRIEILFVIATCCSICLGQGYLPEESEKLRQYEDIKGGWDKLDAMFADIPDDALFDNLDENYYLARICDITRCELTPKSVDRRGVNAEEISEFADDARNRWQSWWKSTGTRLRDHWNSDAAVHESGWRLAAKELGLNAGKVKPPGPIWIPKEWQLDLEFSNGDYGGYRQERWLLDRSESYASLVRLESHTIGKGPSWWISETLIQHHRTITTQQADQLLAAVTYLSEYHVAGIDADASKQGVNNSDFYYPNGTLELTNEDLGEIWVQQGMNFLKSLRELSMRKRPYAVRWPDVGIARALLIANFNDDPKSWQTVYVPEPRMVDLLSRSPKRRLASILLQEFGDQGDLDQIELEIQQLQKWKTNYTATLKDRAGRHLVESEINHRNHFPFDLMTKKYRADNLRQNLSKPEIPAAPRVEKRTYVDWEAAGNNLVVDSKIVTKAGDTCSVTVGKIVYTWRVAHLRCKVGEDGRKTCSGLMLVRQSATVN